MDKVINQLPPQTVYEQYGRTSKLLIHPKDVPQILLQLFDEQRQASEKGEKEINTLATDDTPDKSRSRTEMFNVADDLCENELFTLEEVPPSVDMCDKSRNREGLPLARKTWVKQFENVPVINNASAVIDTHDVSRSRLQTKELQQKIPTTDVSASLGKADVDTSIDANDESKTRTYKSTLTVICGSRQQVPDAVTEDIHTQIDTNDESRGRGNRWSMSTHQHSPQLVTSVGQDRNVGPIVVNIHDIDKCLATNKHEPSIQHSIQTNNQGLFSAFSKFTSNVLGKNSNKAKGGIRGKYQCKLQLKSNFQAGV